MQVKKMRQTLSSTCLLRIECSRILHHCLSSQDTFPQSNLHSCLHQRSWHTCQLHRAYNLLGHQVKNTPACKFGLHTSPNNPHGYGGTV
jgi:hypothetical protein